ncbi:hypothetical protein EJ110_NYTH29107 [Nymphaea thermarum]|nr:hypothetical protein EJ110_NYTH29107 [Nymphaea thermarum]
MESSREAKYPYPYNLNVANFVSLKLTQSNFLLWKTQLLGLIESQNMRGFINGNYPKPAEFITRNNEFIANIDFLEWKKSDSLLRGWITGTLSEEVLGLVVGLETSKEVWDAFITAFAHESREREFLLTQRLQLHRKKDLSVSQYLREFKAICDELAAIGKPISDQYKVFWLLNGLGSGYEAFVTSMLTRPPTMQYTEVVALLQAHETMHTLHAEEAGINHHSAFIEEIEAENQEEIGAAKNLIVQAG